MRKSSYDIFVLQGLSCIKEEKESDLKHHQKQTISRAMIAVLGMEKCHCFPYVGHFILQTDQKPLVSLFKKHIVNVKEMQLKVSNTISQKSGFLGNKIKL